jgi:hypothetical protein
MPDTGGTADTHVVGVDLGPLSGRAEWREGRER